MKNKKIGLLGPSFTYSDLATKSREFSIFFANKKPQKFFFTNIRNVIEELKKKKIDYALVPIENSTYGTVRETEDSLFQYEPKILFAFSLEIHHVLLAKNGIKRTDIKKIYAHQQGLEQCEKFLQKYFKNAQRIGMGSSGQALEYITHQKEKNQAAIGPEIAAKKYNLEIIEKNIENEKQNRTMFLVLGNSISERKIQQKNFQKVRKARNLRTSIVFWFGKNKPGSLYGVLREFAKAKLNLSKIESRPASRKLGEYLFFLDFDADEKDIKTKKVLRKISKITAGIKLFGSYEVH